MGKTEYAVCNHCKNCSRDLWTQEMRCVVFGKKIENLHEAKDCLFWRDLKNYRWNEEFGYVEYKGEVQKIDNGRL